MRQPSAYPHPCDLLIESGIENERILDKAQDVYTQVNDLWAPTLIEPGEVTDVQAALLLPVEYTQRGRLNLRVIALSDLPFSPTSQRLDQPILRTDILPLNAATQEHGDRVRALERMVQNWRSKNDFEQTRVDEYDVGLTHVAASGSDENLKAIDDIRAAIEEHKTDDGLSPIRVSDVMDDLMAFRRAFNQRQKTIQRRRSAHAFAWFQRYLDRDIVRLARDTGQFNVASYNYAAGDGDTQKALFRQQALRTYPLFAETFILQRKNFDPIGAGHSPTGVVAEHCSSSFALLGSTDLTATTEHIRPIVRNLRKRTFRDMGKTAAARPKKLVQSLTRIPINWIPQDRENTKAMKTILATADIVSRATDVRIADLVASVGDNWASYLERIPNQPSSGLSDLRTAGFDQLVLPEICRRIEAHGGSPKNAPSLTSKWGSTYGFLRKRAQSAFFGKKSLLKILRANEAYHRRLRRLDALGTKPSEDNIAWPALSPEGIVDDYCFVPLTSPEALKTEAEEMDHCVGGYTDTCLSGSHILSVRDRDGNRVATAQIDEDHSDPQGPGLDVRQVSGPNNAEPDTAVVEAVGHYARIVESTLQPSDFHEMARIRADLEEQQQADLLSERIGFDYRDETTQEAIWQEWRAILPGSVAAEKTYAGFLTRSGLDAAIEQACCKELGFEHAEPESNPEPDMGMSP